ncbi:hypothetical protein P7C70_g5493, partial [Phenoliferia sp. Uapishka_3]
MAPTEQEMIELRNQLAEQTKAAELAEKKAQEAEEKAREARMEANVERTKNEVVAQREANAELATAALNAKATAHMTVILPMIREDDEVCKELPKIPEFFTFFKECSGRLPTDVQNLSFAHHIIGPIILYSPYFCQDAELLMSRVEFGTTAKDRVATRAALAPWYRKDHLLPWDHLLPSLHMIRNVLLCMSDDGVLPSNFLKFINSIVVRYSVQSYPSLLLYTIKTVRIVSAAIQDKRKPGPFHKWNPARMDECESIFGVTNGTYKRNAEPTNVGILPKIISAPVSEETFRQHHLIGRAINLGQVLHGVIPKNLVFENHQLPDCAAIPKLPFAGNPYSNSNSNNSNGGGGGGGNTNNNRFGHGGGQGQNNGKAPPAPGAASGAAGGNAGPPKRDPKIGQFCPPCGTTPQTPAEAHYWRDCTRPNTSIEKRVDDSGKPAWFSLIDGPNRFPLCMSANWSGDGSCSTIRAGKNCPLDHLHCATCGSRDHKGYRCPQGHH